MKIDFKLESDNVWRAYVKISMSVVEDCLDSDFKEYLDSAEMWMPIATSRFKEVCIREAKENVKKVPKHYFKVTR